MSAPGNERLKQLILQRGWTRREVAERINAEVELITGRPGAYGEEQIRKLIRGETTWPHEAYRKALSRVFQVNVEALGLRNKRAAALIEHPIGSDFAVSQVLSLISGMEVDDMQRRELLAALGAAVPGFLTILNSDELMRTASAFTAPSRVDAQTVRNIDTVLTSAKALDDQLGPQASIRTILAQAQLADQLLKGYSGTVKPQLLSLRSRIGISAGWQAYDLGDHAIANQQFTAARDAADQANDAEAGAFGLSEWATMTAETVSPGAAVDQAVAAESRAARHGGDPLLRAHTASIAASMLARAHEATSARAAYNRAIQLIQTSSPATPETSLAYFASLATIHYHGAKAMRLIGDTAAATTAIRESLIHTAVRDRAVAHLLHGAIQIDTGEYAGAVESIVNGVKAAGGNASIRIAKKTAEARRALQVKAPGSSIARELDDRLTAHGVAV